ncbi:MAG: glycosyltransferase family 39 protein [Chloroflexota bacterium]
MTETSPKNANNLKKALFGLPHIITWILILATVAAFGLWGFSHLDGFSWSWDESLLIATARAVNAGNALYEEIWYDYPPLFPLLLQPAFRLGSEPIQAARGLIVVCSLVTLISAGWITHQVSHSDLASITAVLLLLLAPPFVANSRAALADLPALTLAALALATTLHGKKSEARPWFAVAGFLYSASLAIKPTSYFVILPMIVLLWTGDGDTAFPLQDLTALVERLLFVAGGCTIGLILFFAWVPMRAFLQQLLQTYWGAQQHHGFEFVENLRHVWLYFVGDEYGGSQCGLFSLSAFGCLAMLMLLADGVLTMPSDWRAGHTRNCRQPPPSKDIFIQIAVSR